MHELIKWKFVASLSGVSVRFNVFYELSSWQLCFEVWSY